MTETTQESGLDLDVLPREHADQLPAQQPQGVLMTSDDAPRSEQFMVAILNASQQPTANLDNMEKLWEFYQRVQAAEAEAEFKKAFAKAQAQIPEIIKRSYNKHTDSWYADLGEMLKQALPHLNKNKLTLSFKEVIQDDPGVICMEGRLSHAAGHVEVYSIKLPVTNTGINGSVNMTPIHAKASAISYAERYLTGMILALPLTRDDDANPPEEIITVDQAAQIKQRLQETQSDVASFCKLLQIDNVDAMPAKQFTRAMNMINKKERQNANH